MTTPITFQPVESFFDPTFWTKFYDNKLEVYKLDESGVPIYLSYSTSPHVDLPAKVSAYGEYSFTTNPATLQLGPQTVVAPSTLHNYNSFQSFKESDKKELLQHHSKLIWQDMLTLATVNNPSSLNRNFIISYSDLKQYIYTHWSCFPSFSSKDVQYLTTTTPQNLDGYFQYNNKPVGLFEWAQLIANTPALNDITRQPVFLYNKLDNTIQLLQDVFNPNINTTFNPTDILQRYAFVIIDPTPKKDQLGWFSRNALLFINLLLAAYDVPTNAQNPTTNTSVYNIEVITIKNFRELTVNYQEAVQTNSNPLAIPQQHHTSIVYNIITNVNITQQYSDAVGYMKAQIAKQRGDNTITLPTLPQPPTTTGWEKYRDKLQPKQTTAKNMDPMTIYSQAVDMNLKLLKWQHWPEMDLAQIRTQKCLLIGSGTLGCYVSRLLLGWGIKDITMLDYGYVSASNPVRQPLFTYQDWLNKKHKAPAAAEALQKIHPQANVKSAVLSIPSAGTVSEKEMPQQLENAQKLAELVVAHDVVFLLTDSRASRWLPTLLAQAYGKRTITAAIGPDSFVALRHGTRQKWYFDLSTSTTKNDIHLNDLQQNLVENAELDAMRVGELSCGCYFCPDQAAPVLGIPQSIDQQCTVTRAEVAALASAYAVNLFIQEVTHKCIHRNNNSSNNDNSDENQQQQQQQQQQQKEQSDVPEVDDNDVVEKQNNENGDTNSEDDDDDDDFDDFAPRKKTNKTTYNNTSLKPTECGCLTNSQTRGSVLTALASTVETNSISCPPSTHCVACGQQIVAAYQKDPIGFLTAAFTDADNVVKMSGFNPSWEGGDGWADDDMSFSDDDF